MDAEAIVVGGGLTGLAAAIAAAKAGLTTIHLAPAGPPDRRTSALMAPSVDYLRSAGLIGEPEALGQKLNQIRIIDATARLIRAPETVFNAHEANLIAFGWNFANVRLTEAFQHVAQSLDTLRVIEQPVTQFAFGPAGAQLTLADGRQLSAPLIVGADGKKSLIRAAAGFHTREHSFTQAALVCDLDLARPLDGTSVEFHYPNGPFTLVPAGDNRTNLVWIDQREVLTQAQALDTAPLAAMMAAKAQHLFGAVTLATPTHIFPLSTITVDQAGAKGVLLVGEAAHAFPPIGAQGLNLGLRDVADFAAVLAASDRTQDGWAARLSQDYARRRADDLGRTGSVVDTLFHSLLTDMLPAQALRAGGLWALKLLPALRKQAFAIGMGAR